MNTNLNTDFDPIESRIAQTLNHQAKDMIVQGAPDDAWNKAQAGRRRVRRARQGVSMLCALAMLSAGFGVYKWQTKPQPTEVTFGEESDLHLIPTWLPDKVEVHLQDGTGGEIYSDPSDTSIWRSEKQMVSLSWNTQPGYGNKETLEKALEQVAKNGSPDGQWMSWYANEINVQLSVVPSLPPIELAKLANSVRTDSASHVASIPTPPEGLTLRYSGPAKALTPTRQWWMGNVNVNSDGKSGVQISAVLPSPLNVELFGEGGDQFGAAASGTEVSVRGHVGKLVSSTFQGRTDFYVRWFESGWMVSIFGGSKENVLQVANGMKVATQQEWDAFPRMGPGGSVPVDPGERRKATEVAATVDVGSSELKVFAGDLITENGCVNIKLKGTGDKDEFCLKPTGKPVLWSGVRTISGKKSVVAIVDLHVDSVALTKESGDASTQIISARSIDDETPAGFVVDTTTEGDKYTWLGVVALPFDGDSPGRIEAFFNTEFDRDAPSGEAPDVDADPNAEAAAGSDTNEEYDAPLKSLGRFEVAN
jgi:hypothetical protein